MAKAIRKQPGKAEVKKQKVNRAVDELKGFGEKIRLRRIGLDNMSLGDVSKKSGVNYVTISELERGMATNAQLSKLCDLAAALGYDLSLTLTLRSAKK